MKKGLAKNIDRDVDNRSVSSMVSRELDELMQSKLAQDEMDEMQIYTLEEQLKDVKDELTQAKFKYEKR